MKQQNWTSVNAAGLGGEMLPPGGYVMRIVRVVDHPDDEYLDVYMDVMEGEFAGKFSGLSDNDMWRCKWSKPYGEKSAPFFKQFLDALEISNRGYFDVATWERQCNEQQFVGLCLGVLFQRETYTRTRGANAGKDGVRLNWFASIPAQDIRNGEFKIPADKDSRKAAKVSTGGASDNTVPADVYGDIPL